MIVNGQLEKATLEVLSSDPSTSVAGRVWFNSTSFIAKIDSGTQKRNILLNDDKIVIGTSGTAATNVRIHRGGTGLLQFVLGNDVTAEGSLSTALAVVSQKIESYTDAGKPAAGNVGRLVWLTDIATLKIDDGAAYQFPMTIAQLSPLTTKGDLLGFSTINARVPIGSNNQVLTADSAQALGLKWANPGTLAYRSVTTTDTATNADHTLKLSGASFTENLFTAGSGNTGAILELVHAGTFGQLYTIDPAGSETIDDTTSHATFILATPGERLKFQSDGTKWIVLSHETETAWTAYTPTLTGFGTATLVEFFWKRRGDEIRIRGAFKSGTLTAAGPSISFPTGINMDTAKIPTAKRGFMGIFVGNISTSAAQLPDTGQGMWYLYTVSGTTDQVFMGNDVDLNNDATDTFFVQQNATTISNFSNNTGYTVHEFSFPVSTWNA